jgi:energy-coupling factor transporter ATP-binding protein EcfA2
VRVPAVIAQKAAGLVGREWALDQVAEWLESGTERLFLLTGEPGSGKSVLAGWLAGAGPTPPADAAGASGAATLARVRGAWSAACFCMTRGQDGADITPAWFVTSLAKQLSARHRAFADAFLRVNAPELIHQEVAANQGTVIGHIGDLEVKLPDARDRYAQGVVEPLRAMAEAHPEQTFAILVDGVDEAFVGPDPTVVSLLARSGSLPGNVRFLVTTRNERALVTQLEDGFGGDVRHLDLSSGDGAVANEADVRLFVRTRLTADGLAAHVEAPATIDTVVEHLAQQAAGNFLFIDFLLDELAQGHRQLTDTADLPTGLFDLYRQYLQRIVPGFDERERGPDWGEHYQPLLGSISVALPAAPADRLLRWLGWEDEDLSRFLQTVEQVTEWEPAADEGRAGVGGWRLYHRSLGDFLAARYVDDRGSDNRFYVAPPKQHDRIVRHYQRSLADLWGGDWAGCDDGYCLRNLVRHMAASMAALERPAPPSSSTWSSTPASAPARGRSPAAPRPCTTACGWRWRSASNRPPRAATTGWWGWWRRWRSPPRSSCGAWPPRPWSGWPESGRRAGPESGLGRPTPCSACWPPSRPTPGTWPSRRPRPRGRSTSSAGRRSTSATPCARWPPSTPTSGGGPTTPTACPSASSPSWRGR